MELFDLSGQTALVTGGNGGLGLAMARGLAKAGANVAILARDAGKNAAAVDELARLGRGEALALTCDVAEDAAIEDAVGKVLATFGRIDTCFANAGISGAGVGIPDITPEGWDHTLTINTRGAALVYKHVTRHMIARAKEGDAGGKLVATSSGQSIMGVNRSSDYAASKAGIIGFTKSIALELGSRNIRSNAIAPGFIETEMTAVLDEKTVQGWRDGIPLKRGGQPEDVANACVFLASDLSSYITGQVLNVDGGLLT